MSVPIWAPSLLRCTQVRDVVNPSAPARMAQALAPLVFGLLIDVMGAKVLIVSSALSLSALVALFLIRPERPA